MLLRNRPYDLLFVDVDIPSLTHHQLLLGLGIPTVFVCPPGQRENVKQIYETSSNGVKERTPRVQSLAQANRHMSRPPELRYKHCQIGFGVSV